MGWGRDELGNHYYWGGDDDLQKLLESNSLVERCALIKGFLKNIEEEANSRLFE